MCTRLTVLGFTRPLIKTILALYAATRPGLSIQQWMDDTGLRQIPSIDVRRFIAYGMVHGILRRVHCYPFVDASRLESFNTNSLLKTYDICS